MVPVLEKLVRKIVDLQFVEMRDLMPEAGRGGRKNQGHARPP